MDRIWIWLLILITTTSCLKDVDFGRHYIFSIPQGEHSSITGIKKYNDRQLMFGFKFNNSAIYDLNDVDQFDTNKLIGYKFGLDPHKNSARFGWRWSIDEEYIVIVAYTYVDGIRDIHDLGYCFVDQICSGEIEETDDEIIYKFQGLEYSISKSKERLKQKYILFPYFGGNKKAPHNIDIELWF